MQADLEFEYPQKLERIIVKADILRLIDDEEEKLKSLATLALDKKYQESLFQDPFLQNLNYESYFDASPYKETKSLDQETDSGQKL